MNVDTGQFQAITETVTALADRVGQLERRVEEYNAVERIMARANMPGAVRAETEAARRRAHLKVVQ